ncbi:hypothetical protein [Aeromonas veronii]
MINIKYDCFYSVTGIYEPHPELNETILHGNDFIVQLLGMNTYTNFLEKHLIPTGKCFSDLNEQEHKKLELKRNTYMVNSSNAVLYISVSISFNEDDSVLLAVKHPDGEGPDWDKLPHKAISENAFGAAATAISLSRPSTLSKNYDLILSQYYAFNESSEKIIKLSNGHASSENFMMPIQNSEIATATLLADILYKDNNFRTVTNLFSESLTPHKYGHLHAFISAWTGLEIFIVKIFKELQSNIEVYIKGAPAHKIFSDRMVTVMNDKYRLLDKFVALAHHYNETDADSSILIFKEIKGIRDKYFHNMEGDIKSLPLDKTRGLLETYLKLYLVKKNPKFHIE